jgi:site-specific DNA-cytosine methylase
MKIAIADDQGNSRADDQGNSRPIVPLRILVACEYSGRVREAFRKLGHDAWSCDLLPSDDNSPYHIQGDVLEHLNDGWDIMIAHPPCTHLAVSGARWFKDKQVEQAEALEFVQKLLDAPIPKIALENPISIISSKIRKPDQIIQPWQFGHGETKATCLWLRNLPELQPTDIVSGRENKVWRMPPSEERWKLRSITYQGIANAMANQWGLI